MTLQEAMASGKAFKRPGMSTYYTSTYEMLDGEVAGPSEELVLIRATDYVVEASAIEGLEVDMLAVAWNAARPRGGSVAAAETSAFFTNFKAKLLQLAAQNVG